MNTFAALLLVISLCFFFTTAIDSCNIPTVENDIEYYSNETKVVVLDFNDLAIRADLSRQIKTAFGPAGLGILFVKNVPGFKQKRQRLLRLSRKMAYLNSTVKKSMESPETLYSIGFSHGVEMLAKDQPDYQKMSFYANPLFNDPTNGNQDLIGQHPAFYGVNIWPPRDAGVDAFADAFTEMGKLVFEIGKLIAHQNDAYVKMVRKGYQPGVLFDIVDSKVPKGRLLYYLSTLEMRDNSSAHPKQSGGNAKRNLRDDNWCGWHNDHSSLTGLTLAMYFDSAGNEISKLYDNQAGLHIKSRHNQTLHLHVDEGDANSYVAFQLGETSQVLSGGALVATPHSVMGSKLERNQGVSRASFALFMQPYHDHHMRAPQGIDLNLVQFDRFLPENVPPLAERYKNETGDTFGMFSKRTFQTYYQRKMHTKL